MNLSGVFFLLGRLLLARSGALLVPAVVAYFDGGVGLRAFLASAAVAAVAINRRRVQSLSELLTDPF